MECNEMTRESAANSMFVLVFTSSHSADTPEAQ
jgi:hypothetical protein